MAEFTLNLGSIVDELEEDITDTIIRRFALGVLTRVIRSSPVDTGRFRSNWQVSFDRPTIQSLNTTDRIGTQTIAQGAREISRFDLRSNNSLFITSNLPYSVFLEMGGSTQAPNGVAGMSVREEVNAFNSYGDT